MSRLWLTGYRSYELGIFSDSDPKLEVIKFALKNRLIEKVETGTTWVIAGPQLGTEQWGLTVANELKKDYPELQTALMAPFADFGKQWKTEKQEQLSALKSKVNFYGQVSDLPYQSPQQLKNYQSFMLEHTDEAVLLYDSEREGKTKYDLTAIQRYQNQNAYDLTTIDFYDLEDEANAYAENHE